jgi:hypothetical protein
MTTILGLLFANGLTFSSFTINGLQTAIDQVTKYCIEWNLECNLNKTKILVLYLRKEVNRRKMRDGL